MRKVEKIMNIKRILEFLLFSAVLALFPGNSLSELTASSPSERPALQGQGKPRIVWLDELDITLSRCGWEKTRRCRSVQNEPLKLGGTLYKRGIGTHADGEFHIRLAKGSRRFTAVVGDDDFAIGHGSVEFIVKNGLKAVLWRSGILRGGQPPKKIDLNVEDVDELHLIVTSGGDGNNWDHADWAMAKFEVTGRAPVAVRPAPAHLAHFTRDVGIAAVRLADPGLLEEEWRRQYRADARINASKYRFPVKQVLNAQALKWKSDKTPVDMGIRRLGALIQRLKGMGNVEGLPEAEKELALLKREPATPELYLRLRKLTRRVVLSNPLLDFDSILFVVRGALSDLSPGIDYYNGDHFCDQYYGHNGRKGGGLFILKNWKSDKAELIDVVKGLRVPSGQNRGMLLSEGTFISPDLSWDGKTILFAWSCGGTKKWDPMNRFSIFRVDVDGGNLQRLRDTPYDEFDPAWLPDGRIVFISSARGGYGRCHGRPVPVYTLFSMKGDGSDCFPLSYHETNEFHPSVDNNGMIVYTRWDYVDRDADIAHHIWHCTPDGRDPRSYHGNYPFPYDTLSGSKFYGLNRRPFAEYNIRAIPGSTKYIATAGPHHGQSFGSLVMLDIHIPDDDMMSQVKRITPDAVFPEAEWDVYWTNPRTRTLMPYGTPWPLDESFYLCNRNQSLCILDEFGNREVICEVMNGMRPIDPIPLRPRMRPPVLPCKTWQGERSGPHAPVATIGVMDVKISDDYAKAPEGTEITALRVVQVIPKSTPNVNSPMIDYGFESLARIPLGTVPVEKDGSVYFRAPVGKAIYFQLLDKNGMAVQSMRSATYVHPGERLTCLGCHEKKNESSQGYQAPIAMRRAPSDLKPETRDPVMFSFYRHVQPILKNRCLSCHQERKARENRAGGPVSADYFALRPYVFFLGNGILIRNSGGSRTRPGHLGALGSRMGRALLNPTHQSLLSSGKLTRDEFHSITLWLDLNSTQFSAYLNTEKQKRGEIVWPKYDVDPNNYTGVERR